MKKLSAFLEQTAFAFSLVCLAALVGGTKACQEDYSLGTQIDVTPSVTQTETPDDTEIADGTSTPAATSTAGVTLTLTATATSAPTAVISELLRSLSTLGDPPTNGEKLVKPSSVEGGAMANAGGSSENWLGNAFQKDENKNPGSAGAIDSDRDGFTDQYEIEFGSDPYDRTATPPSPTTRVSDRLRGVDSDLDGVSDSDESRLGLNPNMRDTEQDGCSDGAEILSGSDPRDRSSRPNDDVDGDCLSAVYEVSIGTDPGIADVDQDGLRDDFELALGGNPLDADSDNDGILDGKEFAFGSDITRPDPHP